MRALFPPAVPASLRALRAWLGAPRRGRPGRSPPCASRGGLAASAPRAGSQGRGPRGPAHRGPLPSRPLSTALEKATPAAPARGQGPAGFGWPCHFLRETGGSREPRACGGCTLVVCGHLLCPWCSHRGLAGWSPYSHPTCHRPDNGAFTVGKLLN